MPFALQPAEPLAVAVPRIADELLAPAAAGLRGGGDPATAVHEARKAAKRLRALVRLARPALGRRQYREANVAARDAARVLAGTRDARVVATTFAALVAEANDPAVYADLQRDLDGAADAVDPAATAAAAEALEALRATAAAWQLRAAGWDGLEDGLAAIYGRGAAAMQRAVGKPKPVRLHEWRKSVKHLWHAVELLAPAWPAVLDPLAEEVHRLSGLLGDDHDLDVLAARLEAVPADALPDGFPELVAARHRRLRAAAFSAGLRVYAEEPGDFTARIGAYFHAWSAG